jgi:putative serine protease PepD
VSWDDSEPTERLPRGSGDPEPTRVLPTTPGQQPPYPQQPPQQVPPYSQQYPPQQHPQQHPQRHPQQHPQRPARPAYQGQAWPTQPPGPYRPAQGQPPYRPLHPQQSSAFAPQQPAKSSRVAGLAAAVALIVGLVSGAGAALAVVGPADRPGSSSESSPSIGNGPDPRIRTGSVADVAQRLLPSVVQLKVNGGSERGTGSGFVIDGSGHILTNNHVVAVAGSGGTIQVVTDKGTRATAKLVGRSPAYDLAVVQVDGLTAPAVQFGQSSQAVVGQDVVAIGSPLGLAGTVTSGIVSAKNRPVTAGGEGEISYINALQTDAAINPGNSGGPLVDMSGRVIGVNSAIATVRDTAQGSSGNIGLGFAIPIDQARRTAEQLIATGQASYPVIGANVDPSFEGGAKVNDVSGGSPAQRAGIKEGDVVTSIDSQKVNSAEALIVAIRTHAPGETVKLKLERDGKTVQVTVTLGQKTG